LASGGWLADEALVVVERGPSEPDLGAPGFEVLDSRSWGAARVWFLRAGPAT
jgi:16S rRNA (guanine966-N2)-methyltransferase